MNIKVLGPGCMNCVKVESTVRQVIGELSIPADVEKVTDFSRWAKYRILGTPGLVVNDKVVCAARIPSKAEVTTWIIDALEQEEREARAA
ncbi:MAG: thioredoxin family protein [Chloroflexi bacterium]|nr:thioredoxin family protein [Chloroflexota bacterium]